MTRPLIIHVVLAVMVTRRGRERQEVVIPSVMESPVAPAQNREAQVSSSRGK